MYHFNFSYPDDLSVTVTTHPTVSLVKYFGVRDEKERLPYRSSFALALENLTTTTTASFNKEEKDNIVINGYDDEQGIKMIQAFIDRFREETKLSVYFNVNSSNNFPTASGLASSGSGFAALALALGELCQVNMTKKQLSRLARLGSGSAVRSFHGGMVLWHRGCSSNGNDCFAETIFPAHHWPELRMIVVVVSTQPKEISTRNAGKLIIKSPSYRDWVKLADNRIDSIKAAIENKNIETVGTIMETDCQEMHHCLAEVGINYHTRQTHQVIKLISTLRENEISCYWTSDAGPQVKILCLENDVEAITEKIRQETSLDCIVSNIGNEPHIESNYIKKMCASL